MRQAPENVEIRTLAWQENADQLASIRQQVFLQEQGVPVEDEWDGDDDSAAHFLAYDNGAAVGCARLLPDGKIGRMAVLANFRKRGIGSALLRHVIHYAEQNNYPNVFLDAQVQALEFYARHGFAADGPEFVDAGIMHRRMHLHAGESKDSSTGVSRLAGHDDCLSALIAGIGQGHQFLDILSQQLTPSLYANAELVEATSKLARFSRRSRVRLLVQDTRPLRGITHGLVQLAQRLPSRVALRGLNEQPQDPLVGYCIIDREALVYFNQEAELTGFVNLNARAETRHLLEEFNHLWEHYSVTDPNLKKLHL